MRTFLHFVGRSYYTPREFIAEARRYGITRRVSIQNLRRMSFGDRVLLATWKNEVTWIFGSFFIERISGLSEEAIERIKSRISVNIVDFGGRSIIRKCGSYIAGPTYQVDASLSRLVEVLDEVDDPGKLMVSGYFIPSPKARIKGISFTLGFRRFNYEKLLAAIENSGKYNPLLHGCFYIFKDDISEEGYPNGEVQSVTSYKRKEEITPVKDMVKSEQLSLLG